MAENPVAISRAFLQALLWWVLLYLLVLHAFVVWNWDSDIGVPADQHDDDTNVIFMTYVPALPQPVVSNGTPEATAAAGPHANATTATEAVAAENGTVAAEPAENGTVANETRTAANETAANETVANGTKTIANETTATEINATETNATAEEASCNQTIVEEVIVEEIVEEIVEVEEVEWVEPPEEPEEEEEEEEPEEEELEEEEEEEEEEELPPPIPVTPWYKLDAHYQQIKLLDAAINELNMEFQKTQDLQQKVTSLTGSFKAAIEVFRNPPSPQRMELFRSKKENQTTVDLTRLREFLRVNDFQDTFPLTEDFRTAFQMAEKDIRLNIDQQNLVDWMALSREFQQLAALIPDRNVVCDTCKVPPNIQLPPLITTNDLDKRVEQVRVEIQRRLQRAQGNGARQLGTATDNTTMYLPLTFAGTEKRLQDWRDQLIKDLESERTKLVDQQQQKQREAFLKAEREKSQKCMQSHKVMPWLEAGLDAIYRNKDLRQALLRRLAEEGLAAGVILDAHLPTGSTRTNMVTNTSPTNLRQLLNGPILTDVASGINTVVDLISGYYDPLDQFLDEMGSSSPDLGRTAVQQVCKAAGSVALPPVFTKTLFNSHGRHEF